MPEGLATKHLKQTRKQILSIFENIQFKLEWKGKLPFWTRITSNKKLAC